MEISPEQLTGMIAIGFGLVRIIEFLTIKGFNLITGKRTVQESVEKIGNNHIDHLTKVIEEGFKTLAEKADKQIELLVRLDERSKK